MNRVCISGRLTKDSETSVVSDTRMVLRFTLVWNFKKKKGEEIPNFFSVALFGSNSRVEALRKIMVKGALVGVEGTLRQRKWTASDGTTRSVVEIHADDVTIFSLPKTAETPDIEKPAKRESHTTVAPSKSRGKTGISDDAAGVTYEDIPSIDLNEEEIPF